MKTKSEFRVKSWNESALDPPHADGPIMRVSAVFEVSGEMDGTLDVEYLMHYRHHGVDDPHSDEARYAGFLLFSGAVGEKTGTFAMEDTGVFAGGAPSSKLTIISYSGTDGFAGIAGSGRYYADHGKMIIELEFGK